MRALAERVVAGHTRQFGWFEVAQARRKLGYGVDIYGRRKTEVYQRKSEERGQAEDELEAAG